MPVFPVLQQFGPTETASGTTVAQTVSGIKASSSIVVCCAVFNGASVTFTSVTDNAAGGSNTYAKRHQSTYANRTSVCTFDAITLPNGVPTSITCTVGTAGSAISIVVFEVANLTANDTGAAQQQVSSTPNAGAITTAQANEIAFVVLTHDGTQNTLTPPSGWQAGPEDETVTNTPISTGYNIFTAVQTAQTYNWSLGASLNASNGIESYKYTPPAGGAPQIVIPNRYVGPMALRQLFRRPPFTAASGAISASVAAPSGNLQLNADIAALGNWQDLTTGPTKIPNRSVGPMAQRAVFRRPPQPTQSPDLGIGVPPGDLSLSAGVQTPGVTATPPAGDLALSAGTNAPGVTMPPNSGNLQLGADIPAPQISFDLTTGPVKIPNKNVGPMALRYVFRRTPQQWQTPPVSTGDITISPSVGDLLLSAGIHTPVLTFSVPAGDLALSAGVNTPTIAMAPSSGNLALSAGVHVPAVTATPPAGNLALSAGTNAPTITMSANAGNLALSGAAITFTLGPAPPSGVLNLSAGVPTITGGTQATTVSTQDMTPFQANW